MLSFRDIKTPTDIVGRPVPELADSFMMYNKRMDAVDVTAEGFENETTHMPNTMYDVDGELYETDDNGNVYMINGRLLPNAEYNLNGYTYTTDAYGRIIEAEGEPTLNPENERDNAAQAIVGGIERRPNDQGGHVIAREMNGDGGVGNLVAMDSRINQSDYKRMETDIRNALNEGKSVAVDVEIKYDGDSERPSKLTATVMIDHEKVVYLFDNNLDGGLWQDVPDHGKKVVDTVIANTDGEVSSIKGIYDEDGKLEKTVVTITYQDEDGNNRRLPVTVYPD